MCSEEEFFMEYEDLLKKHTIFTKSRVETLSDGIFAIAMTLLVTTLEVPKSAPGLSPATLDVLIASNVYELGAFFLSFILLAIFWWSQHERYHHIHYLDRTLIVLTFSSLIFVALLPFSTDLIGNFPAYPHVAVIFELNLLLIGLLTYGMWFYTSNDQVLGSTLTDELFVTSHRNRVLIFPVLSFIAIILALCNVGHSQLIYGIVPVYFLGIELKKKT
jgi:uncharacterized membrane protein